MLFKLSKSKKKKGINHCDTLKKNLNVDDHYRINEEELQKFENILITLSKKKKKKKKIISSFSREILLYGDNISENLPTTKCKIRMRVRNRKDWKTPTSSIEKLAFANVLKTYLEKSFKRIQISKKVLKRISLEFGYEQEFLLTLMYIDENALRKTINLFVRDGLVEVMMLEKSHIQM